MKKLQFNTYEVSPLPELVSVDSPEAAVVLQLSAQLPLDIGKPPVLAEFTRATRLLVPVVSLDDEELIKLGIYCVSVSIHVRN